MVDHIEQDAGWPVEIQDPVPPRALQSVDVQRVVNMAREYVQREPVIVAIGKNVHLRSSPRGLTTQPTKGLRAQGPFGWYYLSWLVSVTLSTWYIPVSWARKPLSIVDEKKHAHSSELKLQKLNGY